MNLLLSLVLGLTLVANCFLGALPPVDLRAVCLVRAMSTVQMKLLGLCRQPSLFIACSGAHTHRHTIQTGARTQTREGPAKIVHGH